MNLRCINTYFEAAERFSRFIYAYIPILNQIDHVMIVKIYQKEDKDSNVFIR